MSQPDYANCAVCDDQIMLCTVEYCNECFTGEHPTPMCSCCYEYICDKHTAPVTCPHKAAAHEAPS